MNLRLNRLTQRMNKARAKGRSLVTEVIVMGSDETPLERWFPNSARPAEYYNPVSQMWQSEPNTPTKDKES